jgi:DNA-directed RNA polymerase subunit RPC12/RpoP
MTDITVQARKLEPSDHDHIRCPMCGQRGEMGRDFKPSGEIERQQVWRCGSCGSDLVVHRGRFRTRAEWAGPLVGSGD